MLLDENEFAPVEIVNPHGRASFLLIGDHAGRGVPHRLGDLGLPVDELSRHIGWDIGVAALGEALATSLDAVFVRQRYSRLVVDCNRDPAAVDAMPEVSDQTRIPGNVGLTPADRAARVAAIHAPYHRAIADEIARRATAGIDTILVALHSFTPAMQGVARPWQIGVLHDAGDTRFALAFLAALRTDAALSVGDNEPYRMDGIDYTVPRHAFDTALPYVEIEVRQDLVADAAGVAAWAARIEAALIAARAAL